MAKVTEAAELGHMYGLRCLDSDGRRSSTVVSLTGSICLVAKIVRFFNLSRKIKPFVTLFYSSFWRKASHFLLFSFVDLLLCFIFISLSLSLWIILKYIGFCSFFIFTILKNHSLAKCFCDSSALQAPKRIVFFLPLLLSMIMYFVFLQDY